MEVGIVVAVDPMPSVPENTRRFPAGAVTFGVEHRMLTDAMLEEHYGDDPAKRAVVAATRPALAIDDTGLSLHVFGSEDGREYLRFDCFKDNPHYHYVMPDQPHQRVVAFDEAANGDPFPWAMRCLRERLAPMLREAGGVDLADSVDLEKTHHALDRIERLLGEMTTEGHHRRR